jgi:hypothetical protein
MSYYNTTTGGGAIPTPCSLSGYGEVEDYCLHVLPVSVEEQSALQAAVFPNPCEERVIIYASHISSIALLDSQGRCLLQQKVMPNAHATIMDMRAFSSGMYSLRISTEMGVIVKKLVKN